MNTIMALIAGFAVSFLLPMKYRARPLLSVAMVWCRRTKHLKWLLWRVPFTQDENWYYDIVERDVWGEK